jgi:hypothetical protein
LEKLNNKYQNLIKSLGALGRSVELYKSPHPDATLAEQEAYTASVIKHFEFKIT